MASILVVLDTVVTTDGQVLYWNTTTGYNYGDWVSGVRIPA